MPFDGDVERFPWSFSLKDSIAPAIKRRAPRKSSPELSRFCRLVGDAPGGLGGVEDVDSLTVECQRRQHGDDLHRDVGSAGRLHRDVCGDLRSQRLRDLPAKLATKDDVYHGFMVSEQGYVDRAAERDEAGYRSQGQGNRVTDLFSRSRCLGRTPQGRG